MVSVGKLHASSVLSGASVGRTVARDRRQASKCAFVPLGGSRARKRSVKKVSVSVFCIQATRSNDSCSRVGSSLEGDDATLMVERLEGDEATLMGGATLVELSRDDASTTDKLCAGGFAGRCFAHALTDEAGGALANGTSPELAVGCVLASDAANVSALKRDVAADDAAAAKAASLSGRHLNEAQRGHVPR